LKINYHKSEVVVFGVGEERQQEISNMLNCKLGKFPMKYLGFPISDKNLGVTCFGELAEKMGKKLQPWKGKHLSSGGRLILTNASLSNMPTYVMGMFLLPETTHQQMDEVRSKFLWRGHETKFKYHMVRWENVCFPKVYGGMGVINTRKMNEALLTKWIWRILENREDDLYCKLLRNKYMATKPFALSTAKGGSQFWKGIQKIKHFV